MRAPAKQGQPGESARAGGRSPSDDSLMGRFDAAGERRFRAREAVLVVLAAAIALALCDGSSIVNQGDQMTGLGGRIVRSIGRPFASASRSLKLASVSHDLTGLLSPNQSLGGGGFGRVSTPVSAVAPVTADAFSPESIGAPAPPRRVLHTLLVTGDSLSTPLDGDIAQRLVPAGVRVIRDPHLGTGISKSTFVDWGKLSSAQVASDRPDAVILFIGANEGWPMSGPGGRMVQCCGAEWAALYAERARAMTGTYRRNGAARVYWITVPTPREAARQQIARVVNAAIGVAVEPWLEQVTVIDSTPIFTPNGYRDAMPIGGQETIVRQPDGIHLNDAGSNLLAAHVLTVLRRSFRIP